MKDDIEIDLGRFLSPVLFRWKLILAFLVAGILAGLVLTLSAPTSYEAVASIAIVKTRTDVQFDPRIRTLLPTDAGASVNEARRNALVGLVTSPDIATKAVQRFGGRLTELDRNPARLLQKISGESITRGDLVLIKARQGDPVLAAELATFWAREYESLANNLYAGTSPDYLKLIKVELDRSHKELDEAQKALNEFINSNEIDALKLRIASLARRLDSLEASQLAPSLSALQRSQSALAAVGTLSESQQRVRQLRTLAASMRDQVRTGGDSAAATNFVPLINLKMQVYAVVGSRSATREEPENTTSTSEKSGKVEDQRAAASLNPTRVDISSSQAPILQVVLDQPSVPVSATLQIQDLDALVATLDKLDGELSSAIQEEQQNASKTTLVALNTVDANLDVTTSALSDLRSARAQLESQEQQLKRLEESRDLAVSTFRSLSAKLAEVEVSNAVANREVRLASEALPPANRVSGGITLVLLGVAAGLVLGVLIAVIAAARAGDFRKPTLS